MSYTPKNKFNLKMIETGVDLPVYTPENNSNLQLKRTGVGDTGFQEKLLADVACCDNLKGYEYYGGFPLETSLEFSRDMAVHGGCPNFSWEVVDSVYFTFAHATTTGRTNTINADPAIPIDAEELAIVEDNCGHKLVFVILYCGEGISIIPYPPIPPDPPDDPPYDPPWPPPPSEMLCIPDPYMYWDVGRSASEIAQDSECLVAIGEGINKPFEWSVTGSGFSLKFYLTAGTDNILIASPTACGVAEITVVGCDGVSVTGYVRCAVGQWVRVFTGLGAGPEYCWETGIRYRTKWCRVCCNFHENMPPHAYCGAAMEGILIHGNPPCWTGSAACPDAQGIPSEGPWHSIIFTDEWQC